MKLIIGNKNYSSWSLRAWMLLSKFDIQFEEVLESLERENSRGTLTERLKQYSPTGRVPVLIDQEITVWDSLAICEYISEKYLSGEGWPAKASLSAEARSVCAEMHAGFVGLRNELPMNCRARRKVDPSAAALQDIARIDAIWSGRMERNPDTWLFEKFSIADCFYAPVVMRFKTYDIALSALATQYQNFFLKDVTLQKWVEAGKAETEVLPEDEAGEPRK
ncbi:glutathione S-transferase family protein [cf. Phormidesmis sp. LEGE 11477]|uniref:glutathione S-transferase family protein n=1 Tax=cf. Phormidesmis sp. LEGE 11477 TaxID=1828680 RepID=UPI00187FDA30|nr:glutathione S-transferase family protein [cf. Phormidesmis sp. LEGE 11477]MBE9062191.1 glutathione S-transferase family protein [cf. Phormidesmis sp. LEGE 11477]